jgi:hypothetical protein
MRGLRERGEESLQMTPYSGVPLATPKRKPAAIASKTAQKWSKPCYF